MKKYEAVFDDKKTEGVYAISLVKKPATKEVFIALSDQEKEIQTEIEFSTVDEDEQILIGLVLQPNVPIYRNQDGEEFTVTFKEDTIKKLSYNFFKQDFHKNSTIEHNDDEKISGVTFVESWIVRDQKKDVSNAYGLEYPKGSWLATMKVDDDEIWNDYVKTGKVKGFSIDGLVQLKEIKEENNKLEMADNKIIVALRELLKVDKKEESQPEHTEMKMGSVMLMGGEIQIEYDGETLEAGKPVFASMPSDPEAERVPVPVGKYDLEDGRVMLVEEEGVVSEIREVESEEAQEEQVEANTEAEQPNKIKSILIKYNEEKNSENLLNRIESLVSGLEEKYDAKFKELDSKVLELSEEEIEQTKKTTVIEVKASELNKSGRLLNAIRNN